MAKGQNAEKYGSSGRQWWGKRPLSGLSVTRNVGAKFWKRLLHKIERRIGKKQIKNQL